MFSSRLRKALILILLVALAAGIAFYIYEQRPAGLPAGFASGNGRLEATEVDVATKIAGRLNEVLPREGDMVAADSVVARLDADDLRARVRAFEAQVQQARGAAEEARAGQRKSSSDLTLAAASFRRSESLVARGFISIDKLDHDQTTLQGARAVVAQAKSKVGEADAAVTAAGAQVESLAATLADTALRAPIAGRVLYRLAEPGEVLAAGGKVLTLLDLTDMYMTIYLPTNQAGQVALRSEARIVLDALPAQSIPATVSFVAPQAQFTPREVETRTEREKLMFRITVTADPAWLAAHSDLAKGGMPGVAYVRLDAEAPWPAELSTDGK